MTYFTLLQGGPWESSVVAVLETTRSTLSGLLRLEILARRIAPRTRRAAAVEVDLSDGTERRIIVASQTINGKRVAVQKRKAFAIFVGG